MAGSLIRFHEPPTTDADARLLRAVELIRPVTVDHDSLVRVGGDGDGGYVMMRQPPVEAAISIGVGPDVSWDLDVAAMGVPVHLFDHTVRGLPERVPGGVFHRIGVGSSDSGRLRSLGTIAARCGTGPDRSAWLKMDVEGAEWEVLPTAANGLLDQFDQIVMEMHQLDALGDVRRADGVLRSLEVLRQHHLPVHVHANNYSRLIRFGTFWFPQVIEVSWVNRRLLDSAEPAASLAVQLDRPCDPRVSEIDLAGITKLP